MKKLRLPAPLVMTGARVRAVRPESTAANLGLKADDLLVSLGGQMATSPADVVKALGCTRERDVLRAHWIRGESIMFGDGQARIIEANGRLSARVVLGAQLGESERVKVRELVTDAPDGAWSGFQRAVLDWSGQASERGWWFALGGAAVGGTILAAGITLLRGTGPRALMPAGES